ncbi:hypothetical protein TUBRATIS_24060 [Tubulinosema ratisbonensis]|uniref:Uncharacterized protein n=1 Tax=Tubulinosema ratisbonensis TaxID=291195 RepID=A0A437AIZ2_9MICR|nr:hypothetical protein TUBRATIS_24060 [Tubulinosema ratisbonensis]
MLLVFLISSLSSDYPNIKQLLSQPSTFASLSQNKSEILNRDIKSNKIISSNNKSKLITNTINYAKKLIRTLDKNKNIKLLEIITLNMIKLRFRINYHAERLITSMIGARLHLNVFLEKVIKDEYSVKIKKNVIEFVMPMILKSITEVYKFENKQCIASNILYDTKSGIYQFNYFLASFLEKTKHQLKVKIYYTLILSPYSAENITDRDDKIVDKEVDRLEKEPLFLNMVKFCPTLGTISSQFFKTSDIKPYVKKRLHYYISIMLLKYLSVINLLFDKQVDIFQKKYIPLYKLKILEELLLELHLYVYIISFKCSTQIVTKKFIILKSFSWFLKIINRNYLPSQLFVTFKNSSVLNMHQK